MGKVLYKMARDKKQASKTGGNKKQKTPNLRKQVRRPSGQCMQLSAKRNALVSAREST
jgi:hypothetical protein